MKYLFLITVFSCLISANDGNSAKGLTYYKFILKPILIYNGTIFTKKYTRKQWQKIFSNDAKMFKDIFSEESKEMKVFLNSEKFNKIKFDLEAFAIEYSKNSSNHAVCEE